MRPRVLVVLMLLGVLAAACGPGTPRAEMPGSLAAQAEEPAGASTPTSTPNSTPAPPHLLMDTAVHRLRWELTYRNPGEKPATVTLQVPMTRDREDYQEAEVVSVSPAPERTVTDEWGNQMAVLTLKDVPPGGTARATVECRVTRRGLVVDADARRAEPPAQDLAPYLRAEEHILADDPVIRTTAEGIVAGETHPYYRLVKLYDFVRTLDYQLEKEARDSREVLRDRVAQCADAAGLLTSLARSQGIPCRYVAGVYLRPEEPATRTTHAWVEAWIAPLGWLPLDPTMGRFEDTRTSRLGQLESAYVVVWEGRGSQGFSASEKVDLVLHHELESREFRRDSAVPVPSLTGNPRGPAGDLLARALASPDPQERIRLAREGLARAPHDMALYRVLVASTPPGPAMDALADEFQETGDSKERAYARGLVALEQQRYSAAEQDLQAAGDSFLVRHALADLYVRTHQPSRAAQELGRATKEFATLNLAEESATFFQALDDPAGVAGVCQQALKLFPKDPNFRLAGAQAAFQLGRREEADRQFAALRREDPGNGAYSGFLGTLYLQAGDRPRARALLQQGLKGRLDERERAYFQDLLEGLEPPG